MSEKENNQSITNTNHTEKTQIDAKNDDSLKNKEVQENNEIEVLDYDEKTSVEKENLKNETIDSDVNAQAREQEEMIVEDSSNNVENQKKEHLPNEKSLEDLVPVEESIDKESKRNKTIGFLFFGALAIVVSLISAYIHFGVNKSPEPGLYLDDETYVSWEELVVKDYITVDGDTLFAGSDKIEGKLVLPDSITNISDNAFFDAINMKEIIFGDELVSVGDFAFFNCNNLKNVQLSEKTTLIGSHAFAYCSSLENISLPDGIKTIETGAFAFCSKVENFEIPSTIETVGDNAFLETKISYSGELSGHPWGGEVVKAE